MIWLFCIFRKWWRRRVGRQFLKRLESEIAGKILEILLRFMSLWFKIRKKFRDNNISDFNGRYQFSSTDNWVTVAAVFTGKGLKVKKEVIGDADVSMNFRDGKSLMKVMWILLATDRDVLKLVLNNEVQLEGNLNYIYKFIYMAKHIPLALTGRLP